MSNKEKIKELEERIKKLENERFIVIQPTYIPSPQYAPYKNPLDPPWEITC